MADNTNNNNDKGRGWHGDPQGHAKAGRKGGTTTARNHGSDFYKRIGRKGGQARKQQMKNSDMSYEELGEKGGQARKRQLNRTGSRARA